MKSKRELRVPERRTFERYRCCVQLAPNVTMVDVSEGGAQLECAWKVPVGAVVDLPMDKLFPATISLRIPFQVVYVRQLPETGRHRIHGRFLETHTSPLEAFRAAVRQMDFQQS